MPNGRKHMLHSFDRMGNALFLINCLITYFIESFIGLGFLKFAYL